MKLYFSHIDEGYNIDKGYNMDISLLIQKIKDAGNVAIYGAGIVATGVYTVFKELYGVEITAFLVSDENGNPESINSVPVILAENYSGKKELILIAVPQVHYNEIQESLIKYNFTNYIYINADMENKLLNAYYAIKKEFPVLSKRKDKMFESKFNHHSFKIYMAKSHVDKPLTNRYEIPWWITPVQAGTDLTEKRIAEVLDNMGDNISLRNADYCELTVTYWIWKNAREDYVGLCHYRRIFDLNEKDIQSIREEETDAVLLYPTIHYKGIINQHLRYLDETEWEILWQAIETISPDEAPKMKEILKNPYFYNYNMVIAKRTVFNQYCEWMFAVLEEVRQIVINRNLKTKKRYIGYMGETLTTLFFLYNKNQLRIVHTGKLWCI